MILGFISLVLAVVNLFPFLPLDGGHVVWALAEKARGGRRVPVATMWRFSSVGDHPVPVPCSSTACPNDITRLGG